MSRSQSFKQTLEYKQKHRDWQKKSRLANPEKSKQIRRNSYNRHILENQKESRRRRNNYRFFALDYYSKGELRFACCEEPTYEFLTIDHIDNNGKQHREKIGSGVLYSWLKTNNYPKGFQVLCYNCNMTKGHYGKCVHEKEGSRNI